MLSCRHFEFSYRRTRRVQNCVAFLILAQHFRRQSVIIMKPVWIIPLLCLVHIAVVYSASSLFNTNKVENKFPKRGNGLRRAFSKDNVRYLLYSNSSNLNESNILRIGDAGSLLPYNASKSVTIIIHGFKQNATDKYPQQLKNALLKIGEPSNIIISSWLGMTLPFKNPHIGLPLSTREASKNVQRVSKHMVEFITYLRNETKLKSMNDIHLIGYGLGAHIAGVVGFRIKQTMGESVGRITGLDPSGPQHNTYTALSEKLDKTDGKFVMIVHTANGPFGRDGSIGHIDYFPNGGGPTMPECLLPADPKRDLEGFPGSCSSALAWDYYTRSVLENDLTACETKSFLNFKLGKGCEKQVTFGHHALPSVRGDYFLSIRSQE